MAGDSAGGNLAAVVAQHARVTTGGPALAAQLLIYPGHGLRRAEYPSEAENAEGYFLTRADMAWFAGHYVAGGRPGEPAPFAAPRGQTSSGLPPAVVATAEFDPLRDQGDAYADALERGRACRW